MKKFKLLSSIAAVAAVSCVAAASSMAADSVVLELDAASSTADAKVVNVYYVGDTLGAVKSVSYIDIMFDGATEDDIDMWSDLDMTYEMTDEGAYSLTTNSPGKVFVEDGRCLMATLEISNSGALGMEILDSKIAGGQASNINKNKTISLGTDNYAVVSAEDLGVFADGEGAAVKAYKAAAAVDGTITWNVTDGENVATVGSEVSGGADVIVGLRVAGANVANITYAAVTID